MPKRKMFWGKKRTIWDIRGKLEKFTRGKIKDNRNAKKEKCSRRKKEPSGIKDNRNAKKENDLGGKKPSGIFAESSISAEV